MGIDDLDLNEVYDILIFGGDFNALFPHPDYIEPPIGFASSEVIDNE